MPAPAPAPPPRVPVVHALRTRGSKWGPPARSLCNRKVAWAACSSEPHLVTCATCKRRLVQRIETGCDDGAPTAATEP